MASLRRHGFTGNYWFVERNGKYSETFSLAGEYKNGFAIVQKTPDSPEQYRDLLGRLSVATTKSGADFNHFCEGTLTLHNIPIIHFADMIFCEGVKGVIKSRLMEDATRKYQIGLLVSKSKYQQQIKEDFSYINQAHETALKLVVQEKKEKEEKLQALKRKTQQQEAAKARVDAYNDTIEFLENV